jgi:hypothetical protein
MRWLPESGMKLQKEKKNKINLQFAFYQIISNIFGENHNSIIFNEKGSILKFKPY